MPPGGAVFFALGTKHARISDANSELIATYRAIRSDPEGVMEMLDHIGALHEADPAGTFERYRGFAGLASLDDACIAARFIYLNKTCFNGLYRVNKSGRFNVSIGTKGKQVAPVLYDTANILACSAALQRVSVECRDFRAACSNTSAGDFVYFDPPYAPVSATSDFTAYTSDGFSAADQAHVRDTALKLKRRGVGVLISNSVAPLIRDLYAGPEWRVEEIQVQRTNAAKNSGRGAVTELLIS